MQKPTSLFAIRKVFFEERWHIRCVNCSDSPANSWNWRETWEVFSDSKQSVLVALPDEECETSGIPLGPSIVYGMDDAIGLLPTAERTRAIVAQNHVIVVTSDDLSGMELPRFLSDKPFTTKRTEFSIKFNSPFLEELPDVREFEKKTLSGSTGKGDLGLLGSTTTRTTRIPAGLHLPATVELAGIVQPVVYSIKEWRSDNEAMVECYASDQLLLDENTLLKRSVAGSSTEVLGTFRRKS